jgi:hypothetical protein
MWSIAGKLAQLGALGSIQLLASIIQVGTSGGAGSQCLSAVGCYWGRWHNIQLAGDRDRGPGGRNGREVKP